MTQTLAGLWWLARPRGMVLVLGLPASGYGFGHWEWAASDPRPGEFLVLLLAWWLLSAGTLWLNAALDRDEGEVLMGTPRTGHEDWRLPHLSRYGIGALALALVVALPLGPAPFACLVGCVGMAVAYSHPRTAWKGHAVLGPLVNIGGYGVLSPLAGWSLTGLPATPRTAASLVLVAVWIAGMYFGAQAFQQAEDAARGYRTLVVSRGPAQVVQLARALFLAVCAGTLVLSLAGWYPRALLVSAPGWYWLDAHLARWILTPGAGPAAARSMLRRATVLALLVLGGASWAHLDALRHGRTPAGRDTGVRFGPPPVVHLGTPVLR